MLQLKAAKLYEGITDDGIQIFSHLYIFFHCRRLDITVYSILKMSRCGWLVKVRNFAEVFFVTCGCEEGQGERFHLLMLTVTLLL